MKGCPFCEIMKEQLNREEIEFYDRDIEIYEEEYEMFKEITGNDFVPAFMVVESLDDEPITHLYAPERDFNEIEEGVSIIKELFNR